MKISSLVFGIILVMGLALSKILPHPPNFSPILSMAVIGGVFSMKKYFSAWIPFLALVIGDVLFQFAFQLNIFPFTSLTLGVVGVYVSYGIISLIGKLAFQKANFKNVIGLAFAASIIFFIVSNFFVWLSLSGSVSMVQIYLQAIPFFHNTLISTVLFSSAFYFIIEKVMASKVELSHIQD